MAGLTITLGPIHLRETQRKHVCPIGRFSPPSTVSMKLRHWNQGAIQHLQAIRKPHVNLGRVSHRARNATVSESGGEGTLAGLGSAIDLRSRLQDMDLALKDKGGKNAGGWELIEGAYVRVPAGRAWGCVHFMGGAVLGAFPHIVYDAFLSRVCDEGGLMVIATPYELATDHGQLAAAAAKMRDRTFRAVAARENYPIALPMFGVGHSLGAKLHLLLASEKDKTDNANEVVTVDRPPVYSGHVLVAFNNASAVDTVRLLENFARVLLQKQAAEDGGRNPMYENILKSMPNITNMAQRAAQMAGLEFTPNPAATMERARTQLRTPFLKIVKFSNDDLDMNEELVEAAGQRFKVAYPGKIEMIELAGNHLTPVTLNLEKYLQGPMADRFAGAPKNIGDMEAVRQLADQTVRLIRTS